MLAPLRDASGGRPPAFRVTYTDRGGRFRFDAAMPGILVLGVASISGADGTGAPLPSSSEDLATAPGEGAAVGSSRSPFGQATQRISPNKTK